MTMIVPAAICSLAFALVASTVLAADGRLIAARFYSYVEHQKLVCDVSVEQLARTGVWPEHQTQPPLAPGEALLLAGTTASALLHKPELWKVSEVALRRLWVDLNDNRIDGWIYVVRFHPRDAPPGDDNPRPLDLLQVVVLMDRTMPTCKPVSGPPLREN